MPSPLNNLSTKAVIRFPNRQANGPALVLPRRHSGGEPSQATQALVAASEETRRSIERLVSSTHAPWGDAPAATQLRIEEMQKLMLDLEAKLKERENLVADLESRLAERERDLAETEALLNARERVIQAAKRAPSGKDDATAISSEERAALQALKEELDRQEESLKEEKLMMAERERFMEENENKLFSKMQEHQEREMELEQMAEELALRETKLTGKPPPPPKIKKPEEQDEFRE